MQSRLFTIGVLPFPPWFKVSNNLMRYDLNVKRNIITAAFLHLTQTKSSLNNQVCLNRTTVNSITQSADWVTSVMLALRSSIFILIKISPFDQLHIRINSSIHYKLKKNWIAYFVGQPTVFANVDIINILSLGSHIFTPPKS